MIDAILIILGFIAVAFVAIAFLLYSIMQRIGLLEAEMHDDHEVVLRYQRAYDKPRGVTRMLAEAKMIPGVKDNER